MSNKEKTQEIESYLHNSFIKAKENDTEKYLFYGTPDGIYARLDGYAIIPIEEYFELIREPIPQPADELKGVDELGVKYEITNTETQMKEIVGKTINRIFINEDQSILVFDTNEGDVIYRTEGDCCSETWFADITAVDALIGGTVQSANNVEMESVVDGRTRQEEDEFYGVKIFTDKGYSSIVYRNSSNGYYGGNIDYVEIPRPELLTEITDEWSA